MHSMWNEPFILIDSCSQLVRGNKSIKSIRFRKHVHGVTISFPVHGNKSMRAFLREQPTAITEYDEPLVRRLIEKVTVYEDKFTVEFKSGVTVDVNE